MNWWTLPDAGIRRAGDVSPLVLQHVRFTVRHSGAATGLNPDVDSFRVNPEVDTSGSPMATTRIPMRFSCLLLALMLLSGCSSKPESRYDENIQCRSPNGMRETKTLKRWKYDRVRETIQQLLPEGETGMAFPELLEKVTAEFSKEDQLMMGNVKWHIECTVLEMETAGELTRFPDTPTPLPKNVKR